MLYYLYEITHRLVWFRAWDLAGSWAHFYITTQQLLCQPTCNNEEPLPFNTTFAEKYL